MADKITLKEFMEKTTAAIKSKKEVLAEIVKANNIQGTIDELLEYVQQNSHIFSDDKVEAKIPTLAKLMGKRNATQFNGTLPFLLSNRFLFIFTILWHWETPVPFLMEHRICLKLIHTMTTLFKQNKQHRLIIVIKSLPTHTKINSTI